MNDTTTLLFYRFHGSDLCKIFFCQEHQEQLNGIPDLRNNLLVPLKFFCILHS